MWSNWPSPKSFFMKKCSYNEVLAGIIYKSFQSETNRVILDYSFPRTNPRNNSFEHRNTNQIQKKNLLNIVGQNESMKRIFWKQYGFGNPKLRIRTDSDLIEVWCLCYAVKIREGSWKRPNIWKFRSQIESTNPNLKG
jgi:hypothetical protein